MRAVLFGGVMVLAVWAAAALFIGATTYQTTAIANALSAGTDIDPASLRPVVNGDGIFAAAWSCRDDVMRARAVVAVRAAMLSSSDAGPVPAGVAENARRTIEDLLSCQPADGMGWLELGMSRSAAGAPPEDIRTLIEMSYWTAPNEMPVIRRRVSFVAQMRDIGALDMSGRLDQDVEKLVTYATPKQTADIYLSSSTRLRAEIDGHIRTQREPHRSNIRRAIGDNEAKPG